jgi:hypothetical protein
MRPGVPDDMKEAALGDGEWSIWKLIPSTVSEEDIEGLEEEFGLQFPQWYKAFISTYFHYFDSAPSQPSDDPLDEIEGMHNPLLCKFGYLPFTWDSNDAYILCIDLNGGANEEEYAIVQIDHDILFDFEESTTEHAELKEAMEFLYPNFKAWFDHTFLES